MLPLFEACRFPVHVTVASQPLSVVKVLPHLRACRFPVHVTVASQSLSVVEVLPLFEGMHISCSCHSGHSICRGGEGTAAFGACRFPVQVK